MSKKDIIRILVIVVVLVLAVILARRMNTREEKEEYQIVYNAIKNAALTCYAVEGAYPDNIEYLRQWYQLSYDNERYLVTYEAFSPNVFPTIFVTERGAALK